MMTILSLLIVEDEPQLAELLADYIKQHFNFHIVSIAGTLNEARMITRRYKPHLILLDNFLPDGRGIELIKHLVNENSTSRVVFITADNDMDTISEAIRLGVFDYLIKPVHYQRLHHTLSRFSRYVSSLRSSEQASQQHVDALFNMQSREWAEEAPAPLRGIEGNTLQKIRDLFTGESSYTADSLARLLGSSKTTARRYLEHGVKERFLEAEVVYGRVGRPERVYRARRA
jgi:two-component system response regulator CitB